MNTNEICEADSQLLGMCDTYHGMIIQSQPIQNIIHANQGHSHAFMVGRKFFPLDNIHFLTQETFHHTMGSARFILSIRFMVEGILMVINSSCLV